MSELKESIVRSKAILMLSEIQEKPIYENAFIINS